MSVNKTRLRAELFKCAAKGEFPAYSDMLKYLEPRIASGWRAEWTADLNQIAMEERSPAIQILPLSYEERIITQVRLSSEKLTHLTMNRLRLSSKLQIK